jgi:TetR/AcrR family transcriptional regulator
LVNFNDAGQAMARRANRQVSKKAVSKPQPLPAQTRRGRRRQESEARILAAAEEIFAATGFAGATTAMIARRARIPKANLHYYFGTKTQLYRRVLERILEAWLASGDEIRPDADPETAFTHYIAAKIEASRRQPHASKVFANEILHGAPQLSDYLRREVRRWVEAKAAVLDGWARRGLIAPVDARHLFFVLWAATQTYADFEAQLRAVLGRKRLRAADYRAGAALITRMILATCRVGAK